MQRIFVPSSEWWSTIVSKTFLCERWTTKINKWLEYDVHNLQPFFDCKQRDILWHVEYKKNNWRHTRSTQMDNSSASERKPNHFVTNFHFFWMVRAQYILISLEFFLPYQAWSLAGILKFHLGIFRSRIEEVNLLTSILIYFFYSPSTNRVKMSLGK